MVPCADPVPEPRDIPAMIALDKETAISTDRERLVDCGRRHWLLIQYVEGVVPVFDQAPPT